MTCPLHVSNEWNKNVSTLMLVATQEEYIWGYLKWAHIGFILGNDTSNWLTSRSLFFSFLLVDQRMRDGLRAIFSNLCTKKYITFCTCKINTAKKYRCLNFKHTCIIWYTVYFIQDKFRAKLENIAYQANFTPTKHRLDCKNICENDCVTALLRIHCRLMRK